MPTDSHGRHPRGHRIRGFLATIAALAIALALAASSTLAEETKDSAKAPEPPTDAELAAISERGRILAGYDEAAWYGTDAVQAVNPNDALVHGFIAVKETSGKWRVVFGKRSESDSAFLVAYEAVQGDRPRVFTGSAKVPPVIDRDVLLRASRALDTARAAHGGVSRPYNMAVIPAPAESWFVYAYPAVLKEGLWPIGGDTRYTVSGDGRHVLSTRKLHNSILEAAPPEGAKAGFHTHVLACIPEDTDVMAVLRRDARCAEYIACDPFMYAVDPDGAVRHLGLTDVILKDKEDGATGATPPAKPNDLRKPNPR